MAWRSFAFAAALAASLATRQSPDRAARWRDDLRLVSHTLKSGQYGFARRNDAAAFDAEITALERDAGTLTDAAITLRLMKLVAAAHDGHSHVNMPLFAPFRRLPLDLEWYADGLTVMGASAEYSEALGLRVERIGTMTADEVLRAAAPYISHENEFSLRAESPGFLTVVELLQTIGAADRSARVKFTLARGDGTPLELTIAPGSPMRWSLVNALEARHAAVGVGRRHPEQRYYWFEYLREARAMYVQYNRCENDTARPFGNVVRELFAAAERQPVERWIVDVRLNGGKSGVIKPLREGLKARASGQPVFVLIGPHTFSAAIEAAMDFRQGLKATLVGEPTGGKPNIYGNPKTLALPNSGLHVQYSTAFFRQIPAGDPPAVEPDVRVSATLADALAGRDPVLDRALPPRR